MLSAGISLRRLISPSVRIACPLDCARHCEDQRGNAIKLPRRYFLHLAVGAAALPAVSRIARAQTYPSRPVRWIVPYPPGGATDIPARLIGQYLSERLGQQFVIENRTGAGANIGTEAVVRSPPDGYTLLFISTANMINATYYTKLPFNFMRDIAPVAGLLRVPIVLVVNPSVPAKTVAEFIACAKANPGKIGAASAGIGTSLHLSAELFKMLTGVEGFEAASVFGVGVPTGTPAEIIEKLNGEFNAALANPRIRTRLTELTFVPMPGTAAEFGAQMAATTEKWGRVVKFSGATAD